MDMQSIAQLVMLGTLVLMITGKTPIYMTAITGSVLAALVAGIPLGGGEPVTITKLIIGGLNPVIADMTGILLFIGIMQATGFLDVIIRDIVRLGDKIGGGVGVATAGGVAAGFIGALTGYTQPVVTAVITGPAAIRLGVDPNKVAGIQAHAGHIGNLAGFTHPTQVAILATAGIGFGLFNVLGLFAASMIFLASAVRATMSMRKAGMKIDAAQRAAILREIENREYVTTSFKAFFPFALLFVGFVLGLPIFLVGVFAAMATMVLAAKPAKEAEAAMMKGVSLIATPLVATIGFLFMSAVIKNVGMVETMSDLVAPIISISPVFVMFMVALCTALMTQSYGASAAIVLPFLQIVLQAGADPFAAAFAAASAASMAQYFMTGGPIAALATVIPAVPGCDLKTANAFQRPSIMFGWIVSLAMAMVIQFF